MDDIKKGSVKMKPVLYMVIPCYNEEEVLPVTVPEFLGKLRALIDGGKISEQSRLLFVNDGSSVFRNADSSRKFGFPHSRKMQKAFIIPPENQHFL